jgi:acetyl esterase/lipase
MLLLVKSTEWLRRKDTTMPTKTIEDIVYKTVAGSSMHLDIIEPEQIPTKRMPAVIYIHGGGWKTGSRKGRHNELLAEQGFFTISIDHRPADKAIFPAQLEDVRAAVSWLRSHADEYHIDPERIGVWGHSSGGHLSTLLATSSAVEDKATRVQAVIDLSGPMNLLLMGGRHNDPDSSESILLGGPVQTRVEQAQQANPLTYINSDVSLPPFLIIHGTDDETVHISQAQSLHQALQEGQADVTYVPLQGGKHSFDAGELEQIQSLALAFFIKHLRA